MTGKLLLRGMIAGVVAAVLATLFARLFAEPQVDLAIAFEAANSHAVHAGAEEELVSRGVQMSFGLLTALTLYGAAVGGIFSLIFASVYGRAAVIGPRSLAMLMAVAAFLVVALVPAFKYPPTPPAVGQHETVALRTAAFFAMTGFSILSLVIALWARPRLEASLGAFNAAIASIGIYVAVTAVLQMLLPTINEVPAYFPAVVLWDFRVASLATQALLWAVLGLVFGALADHYLRAAATTR